MNAVSLQEAFKAIPPFAELDDRELEVLITAARTRTYPKGRIIFWEGEPGETFYLLLTGAVKVFRLGPDSREVVLGWLQAGDYFGDMALFDGQGRSASVMTTEASTVVLLPKAAFLTLVHTSGTLLRTCLTVLCRRLREAEEKVAELAQLAVEQRIAKALMRLGHARGVPDTSGALVIAQRPTHQELADLVGTSRETVTRVLNGLAQQGYLSLRGRTVVLQPSFLEHLSRL